MNIYLKWKSSLESLNEVIPLFDLEISQKESSFAKAKLTIDASMTLPSTATEGVLYEGEAQIIFKGLLVGTPIKISGDFAEIELIAKPDNFLEQSIALQKEKRIPPFWDELWIKEDERMNFQEIQSVQTASLYYDRRTGHLSWSDWFEGRQTHHVGQNFFYESLSTKIINTPLSSCTIKVNAHWIQSETGVENLGRDLAHAFPQRKMSTYTKKSLLMKWPASKKRLGRSGIWTLKSELKPVSPTSPLYPRFSPPLSLSEDGDSSKPYRMQRYWFKPTLWVGWQTQQRRKETLSLTLYHAFQALYPRDRKTKTIEFTLQHINPDPDAYHWQPETYYGEGTKVTFKNSVYQNQISHTSGLSFDKKNWIFKKSFHTPLGDPARASFFLTDRGYRAAEHAMERAKVELAKSARVLEVSFESTWESLKNITTDMSVVLTDPRLPGGQVKGKVTRYTLIANGETGERLGRVTLLCTIGKGIVEKIDLKLIPTYVMDGYGAESYQVHENRIGQTPSGLRYFTYDEQTPPQRPRGSLLKRIELIHGPDEQEKEMLLHRTPASLKKALAQKPTRLKVFFKDLRTKERLEHVIYVRMAERWGARS
ncbi:MAG: hypothetical protein JSR85_06495 [Proteobacteria bacterium]|nr:hypothetical protein [Pseudomonadota bacterium]